MIFVGASRSAPDTGVVPKAKGGEMMKLLPWWYHNLFCLLLRPLGWIRLWYHENMQGRSLGSARHEFKPRWQLPRFFVMHHPRLNPCCHWRWWESQPLVCAQPSYINTPSLPVTLSRSLKQHVMHTLTLKRQKREDSKQDNGNYKFLHIIFCLFFQKWRKFPKNELQLPFILFARVYNWVATWADKIKEG